MKGEFTRNTFRRNRHFSGVRLQQGRVQLDADFNEQVDISEHRDLTTAADVIGPEGAPDVGGGFALSAAARLNAADCTIVWRVVGSRGTALQSTDAGATWTAQTLPAAAATVDLFGVCVLDVANACAVGEAGTILTYDGATWTRRTAAPAAGLTLRAVDFNGKLTGWIVGDQGLVLGTADRGETWAKPTVPGGVTETLCAVHFADAQHGWAVGGAGRIITTADKGATWTLQTPPTGVVATLNAVRFASDALHGWAVGDGAAILATTDGGVTWTEQQPPAGVAATLRALAVESESVVWAAGDGGTLLRSTDGGTTWEALAAQSPLDVADLCALSVTDDSAALVAGDLSALAMVSIGGGGAPAFQVVPPAGRARDLAISAGRIYVGGVLCENERPVRYLAQPDLPDAAIPTSAGLRVAYLDVWTRHLTALDRADLREVALAGPDTATRTQTVWQVKLDDDVQPAGTTCAAIAPGWAPSEPVTMGRLRARSSPGALAVNDCMVPAGGGYRRLENQLYRVEIQAPGAPGAATFTWSRDNGAVVARLVATDPAATAKTVTIADPGRDAVGGFAGAALIELTDERRVLVGEPGVLLAVQGVTGRVIKLLDTPPAMSAFGAGATVRRWDGKDTVRSAGWTSLGTEEGVQVEFGDGDYRSGDYWTIPARSLTGDVEWPRQDGAPVFQPREGVEHGYCPLALVDVDAAGAVAVPGDCRPLFTPLVAQTHLHQSAGDGQEVMPPPGGGLAKLPAPLEVVVVNGGRPVNGVKVRFSVVDANERVGTTANVVQEPATVGGVARCEWWLSTAAAVHQVTAELLDRAGDPIGPAVRFDASFSVAASVFYDPSAASDLAGAFTVQEAIDRLSRRTGDSCTVQVKPGDDLQAAVESLPADGGELCLAAGEYKLPDPLHVTKRRRVTIVGRGPSTVLRCGHEVCVVVKECATVEVSHLRMEAGGMGTAPGEQHLMGALTFFDTADLNVHDCELACPDASGGRGQACLTVHGPGKGWIVERARIDGNRLEVGEGQIGMLIVSPRIAEITRNHVVPSWPTFDGPVPQIEAPAPNPFLLATNDARAMGQGITVGGPIIGSVKIIDNVVERAIQGIHVGASRRASAGDPGSGGAWDVRLAGNTVFNLLPAGYERERHAIFVGNSLSTTIVDTRALCYRGGRNPDGPTPMDAIRVIGAFGPYLSVRGTTALGYTVGVRVEPHPDPGEGGRSTHMWLVDQTMAESPAVPVVAPASVMKGINIQG